MLATMRTTGMMRSLAIVTVIFALLIGTTQIGPSSGLLHGEPT